MPHQNEFQCRYGKYQNNTFEDFDAQTKYFAISYHSTNKIIEGKTGFFNMRYNAEIAAWIIFQYVLSE